MAEYIEREAVNSALSDACKVCFDGEDFDRIYPACKQCLLHGVVEKTIAIPSADVAPVKHGRWMKRDKHIFQCNRCGNYLDSRGLNGGRGDKNYCPNCGARMDGEDHG